MIQSIYVPPVWINASIIVFPVSFTQRPFAVSCQSTEGKHYSGNTSIIYLTNQNFKIVAAIDTDVCSAGVAIVAIGF